MMGHWKPALDVIMKRASSSITVLFAMLFNIEEDLHAQAVFDDDSINEEENKNR
jgi:hypothetical protein